MGLCWKVDPDKTTTTMRAVDTVHAFPGYLQEHSLLDSKKYRQRSWAVFGSSVSGNIYSAAKTCLFSTLSYSVMHASIGISSGRISHLFFNSFYFHHFPDPTLAASVVFLFTVEYIKSVVLLEPTYIQPLIFRTDPLCFTALPYHPMRIHKLVSAWCPVVTLICVPFWHWAPVIRLGTKYFPTTWKNPSVS